MRADDTEDASEAPSVVGFGVVPMNFPNCRAPAARKRRASSLCSRSSNTDGSTNDVVSAFRSVCTPPDSAARMSRTFTRRTVTRDTFSPLGFHRVVEPQNDGPVRVLHCVPARFELFPIAKWLGRLKVQVVPVRELPQERASLVVAQRGDVDSGPRAHCFTAALPPSSSPLSLPSLRPPSFRYLPLGMV